jgi:hypothetical protein
MARKKRSEQQVIADIIREEFQRNLDLVGYMEDLDKDDIARHSAKRICKYVRTLVTKEVKAASQLAWDGE